MTHKVCSDGLFSIDRKTGKVTWHYSNGVVLNTTLSITGDRIYFVECRHETVIGAPERRVGRPEFGKRCSWSPWTPTAARCCGNGH
ncbi:MAG: hypothetical protein CM1200mP2_58460 [Planctomycetaceae bacterium]|nr:MAG: hypothetical protein CM1200mP2_58460 [Planctomycetaceae bacterium]